MHIFSWSTEKFGGAIPWPRSNAVLSGLLRLAGGYRQMGWMIAPTPVGPAPCGCRNPARAFRARAKLVADHIVDGLTVQRMETKHTHHILPRLYLKGFVEEPGKPFIWEYRKGQGFSPGWKSRSNPQRRSIRVAGAAGDYYAYPDGQGGVDYDGFENILMRLEQPANPIFEKIRARQFITDSEREVFADYMAQMHRRVQDYRDGVEAMLPGIAASLKPSREVLEILKWADTQEATDAYRAIALREAAKEGAAIRTHLVCAANSPQSELPSYLIRMKWRFFVAPTSQGFLTGDNPVFYFKGLGIKHRAAEVSFPISTEIALVTSWAENHKEGFFPAPSQVVKEINGAPPASPPDRYFLAGPWTGCSVSLIKPSEGSIQFTDWKRRDGYSVSAFTPLFWPSERGTQRIC